MRDDPPFPAAANGFRGAHVRLGFADEAILRHFDEAGLDGRVVEHLEGGELTVTIWLGLQPETRLREVA